MDKEEAINFVNQNSRRNIFLRRQSTVFSNVNRTQNVWWLNIPERKLKMDLHILVAKNNVLSVLSIPANTFTQPNTFIFREDKRCIDLDICCDESKSDYMHDIKHSSKHDFSQYLQEQIKCPQKQVRYPQKQVAYPQKQVKYPQKQVAYPQEQVKYPQEKIKYLQEQVKYFQEQVEYFQGQIKYFQEQIRYLQE